MTTFRLNPSHLYVETGRAWYDTKAGIEKSITTLNDFLRLRHARHNAGYVHNEDLNEIYVFGDYSFDTCGNCSVATPSIKKRFPNIPDVMTHEEYWTYLRVNATDENMLGISFEINTPIPSEQIICAQCNKGWTVENMRNVVTRDTHVDFHLGYFVGQKLKDVKEYYAAKTDARYRIGTEPFLHNKKFIDLSPWTLTPKTDFEKTMVKNGNGWVGSKDGIDNDYVIDEGDTITLSVTHFLHSDCNRKDLDDVQKKSFEEIFKEAGFVKIEFNPIPNEYCGCPHCAPWYIVTTEIGKFKIGWRERVINIDFEGLGLKESLVPILFLKEEVTRGADYIHAWGDKKTTEYLSKILAHCKK